MQSRLIHIKGKLYTFNDLWIMAIINLSHESFFEHHKKLSDPSLIGHVENLISDGADIIDIGALSTRPNAELLSEKEEIKRFSTIISSLKKAFPSTLLSIDSCNNETISFAIDEGADIINDISGGMLSNDTFKKIARNNLAYILTYNRGGKYNRKIEKSHENIVGDSLLFFSEKLAQLANLNVVDILIDPGFGFNKSLQDNFKLLKHASNLNILQRPTLFGLSRKSMIYNSLETTPENALNGTSVLNTFASLNGANILRVHDVTEATELKKLLSLLN